MGAGLSALVQAWISYGPSMITMPLIIITFLFLFSSIPWLQMICYWMVVVYVRFPCFLKSISIYAFFYHHVETFLQLIDAWETLCILVQYGTCVWAGIARTVCGLRSLSRRVLIFFSCCLLPWWIVWGWMLPIEGWITFLVVFGRKTPIIFLPHFHWFCNLKWLIPGFRSEYVQAIPEATSTRAVLSQWSSARDDYHRWNHT